MSHRSKNLVIFVFIFLLLWHHLSLGLERRVSQHHLDCVLYWQKLFWRLEVYMCRLSGTFFLEQLSGSHPIQRHKVSRRRHNSWVHHGLERGVLLGNGKPIGETGVDEEREPESRRMLRKAKWVAKPPSDSF